MCKYNDTKSLSVLNGRYGRPCLAEIPPGLNYSFFTERMGHPRPLFAWRSKFSDFLYKAYPARPVRTIKRKAVDTRARFIGTLGRSRLAS